MKKYLIIFVLFILSNIIFISEASDLRIHFINVGEGDSILIQTPKDKAILIDAGNLITGFNVVEYLKKMKINNLEYLIFTHPHPDHIGGAFLISRMIDTKKIYDNGQDLTEIAKSCNIYRWYEELIRTANNYENLKAGAKLELDNVVLKVLWPNKSFVFTDVNANSLVIMLEFKEFKCLLTGDLTISAEKEILKKNNDLKADVLKISHHGSRYASCEEFLKAVSPKVSIISVNRGNNNGYPSTETLQRLKILNSKIYRTDEDGNIIVEINEEKNIKIITEK